MNLLLRNTLIEKYLDLVLSDMAPKATGHRFTDRVKINRFSRKSNFICKKIFVI